MRYIKIPFIARWFAFVLVVFATVLLLSALVVLLLEGFQFKMLLLFIVSVIVTATILILFKSKRVLFGGESTDKEIAEELEKRNLDKGGISYTAIGFAKGDVIYNWDDVEKVIAIKSDSYGYDTLWLVVIFEDKEFSIDEDSAGWHQFAEHLGQYLLVDVFYSFLQLFAAEEYEPLLIYKKPI